MIPLGVLASARVAAATGGGSGFAYTGYYTGTGAVSGGTITGVDFGAESESRVILVAYSVGTNRTPTKITIGGVSATVIAGTVGTEYVHQALAYAVVPTGTSGSVTATWTYYNVTPPVAVSVYRCEGYTVSLVDSGVFKNVSTMVGALTLTPSNGGFAMFSAVSVGGTLTAYDWSGVSEDAESLLPNRHSTASSVTSASDITADMTVTASANVRLNISAAAFALS